MDIEQPFPTLFALVTTKSCPILSSSFENFLALTSFSQPIPLLRPTDALGNWRIIDDGGDARNARQRIDDVNIGVVSQKSTVEGAVR